MFFIVGFLDWFIFDVFCEFEVRMKWESYVVRVCLIVSEVEVLFDLDVCVLYIVGFVNFFYMLCENINWFRNLNVGGSKFSIYRV